MKNIKNYYKFVNEGFEISDENKEIKKDLLDRIKKSLDSEDESVISEFMSAYIRNQEDNQIESLINDSDIYDFYLTHGNDIDSILSDVNFYDEVPSDMGCFTLYDYIIKGTKNCLKVIITEMIT